LSTIGVGVDCVLAIADLPSECGIKVHNSRGMEPVYNNYDQFYRRHGTSLASFSTPGTTQSRLRDSLLIIRLFATGTQAFAVRQKGSSGGGSDNQELVGSTLSLLILTL
jgi:hypothetical protein